MPGDVVPPIDASPEKRPKLRHVGLEQDDTAQCARAVERPLGSFEDLNRIHVDQLEVGVGTTVTGPHIAEILADRRLGRSAEAGIGDTANEQLVSARAEMGRRKADRTNLDRLRAGYAERRKFIAIDPRPLARKALRQGIALAGRDDDVLRFRRGLRCPRLVPR